MSDEHDDEYDAVNYSFLFFFVANIYDFSEKSILPPIFLFFMSV